jgi:hypothetical protein
MQMAAGAGTAVECASIRCPTLGRRRIPWLEEVLAMNNADKTRGGWSWWYLLFVIQFVVILWPPLYNKIAPTFMGIPFFYWFQMLWVIVSAVFTAVVYLATAD